MRDVLLLAAVSQLFALPAAASATRELMTPLYRFASGEAADRGESLAIADDTRTVLYAYPRVRIPAASVEWRDEPGRRVARVTVPEELAHAKELVVVPSVVGRNGPRALPAETVAVRVEAGIVRFDLTLPAETPSRGRIALAALASPDATGREYVSPPSPIPARALLEFGFGLLELRAADGPVRFEVLVCPSASERDACEAIFTEVLLPDARGFTDRSVSLAPVAGTNVSFRFRAAPVEPGTFFGLPVWSDPTVYVPRRADPAAHNVLLISLDTLGANHLGTFGHARDTSPFIDAWFGEGGTIFEQCFTAATTTGPSHMTLLTALQPSAHGVHGRTYFEAVPDVVPTLALVLAQQGFTTGAVTEDGPMGAYRGFSRGFGSYAENKSAKLDGTAGHIETTFAAGRAWLERNRDKRFFLFLHTFEVHTPFAPPKAYRELFAGDGVDGELEERVPPKWRAVLYDREIRYTDDVLRRFLGELAGEGLLDDTIVVLLSDHGEEFGEHGQLGHGAGIHDEVLRVPLMFRGPGIPAGRRVREPVSHLDFMPTLLALAGVPGESPGAGQSFAPLLSGAALFSGAPLLSGAAPQSGAPLLSVSEAPRPIFSEAWAEYAFAIRDGAFERIPMEVPILVVRQGSRKLVRYPGASPGSSPGSPPGSPPRDVLFDLATDPGEVNPRPANGADTSELRALLDAYARETRATRDRLRGGADQPAPGAALDDERREKLRALGYLE